MISALHASGHRTGPQYHSYSSLPAGEEATRTARTICVASLYTAGGSVRKSRSVRTKCFKCRLVEREATYLTTDARCGVAETAHRAKNISSSCGPTTVDPTLRTTFFFLKPVGPTESTPSRVCTIFCRLSYRIIRLVFPYVLVRCSAGGRQHNTKGCAKQLCTCQSIPTWRSKHLNLSGKWFDNKGCLSGLWC